MAINKKLVHFKTFAKFNEELSAGNILDTSICWIKDTKQIWTHGQFYDCSSLTDEDIVGTALVGYTESVETNENLDLTAEDTIVGAFGKLVKAIKDNEEVDSAAFVKLRDSVGLDENLGFSTSAGDTNVTEAIERIDGKIISTGDGTKFLSDDGTYKNVGSQYLDLSIFSAERGTLSDEDYQKVVKAYEDKVNVAFLETSIYSLSIQKSDNVYMLGISFVSDNVMSHNFLTLLSILVIDKNYTQTSSVLSVITNGSGTKFLSDNGQYKEVGTPIEGVGSSSGTITQELSPNKYYRFGRCTSLTIMLSAETSDILNEYMFEFISGATATVLNLPETVKWNNGNTPTIEANKKYIVSIVSNIAVIGGA